jgi:hypothetical protein
MVDQVRGGFHHTPRTALGALITFNLWLWISRGAPFLTATVSIGWVLRTNADGDGDPGLKVP